MIRLLILLLCLFFAHPAHAQPAGCTTTTCTGSALPTGAITVSGNQFQIGGVNVRLACAEFTGLPNDGSMGALRNAGFNCIRIGWRDATLFTESAPGSAITTTGQTIYASSVPGTPGSANAITITSGQQIAVNGVVIANTAGVVKVYYNADTAYQENNLNNWYGPIVAGNGGNAIADPTGAALSGPVPGPATGCNRLTDIQACVANAATAGLGVILDHRGNEAVATTGSCWLTQQNGLWYDSGGISVGVDGCGNNGNVTPAGFQSNWVALASAFTGNPTVIGAELHQNPLVYGPAGTRAIIGGSGGGTGTFSVNGSSQIIGPNGQPFRATGVDTFAQSLGSIMRLTNGTSTDPLTTVWFPNINMFRIYTSGDSVTSIAPYINALTAQHIVTVIHDTSYIGTCPSGTATTGAEGALISQFLGYANAYKNNPYVWLGSLNEPGGPRSCNNQVMVDFYNSMRCLDATKTVQGGCPIQYNNILEIEGAESTGIDGSLFSFMKNIYIDAHMYGPNVGDGGFPGCSSTSTNLTCFQEAYTRNWTVQTWGIVDADGGSHPPVIVGEFGDSQNGQTIDSNGPQWAAYVANTNPPNGPTEQLGYGAWGIYTFGGESDALIEPNSGAAGSNGTLQSPTGLAIQADIAAGPGVSVSSGGNASCTVAPTANSCSLTQAQLNNLASAIQTIQQQQVTECTTCYPQNFRVGDTILTTSANVIGVNPAPVPLTDKDGNTWSLQPGQSCQGNNPAWWWAGYALNGVQQFCGYLIAMRLFSNGHVWVEEAKQLGWWDATAVNEGGTKTFVADPGPGTNNASTTTGGTQATVTWAAGGSNNSDILQMCSAVGAAINAANSAMVIFCPGPINGSGGTTLLNGQTKPTDCTNISDLSNAGANAMAGFPVNKMAYSAHFYPQSINGTGCVDSGTTLVHDLNAYFGYLEVTGRAPVDVLEMGCSCDGLVGNVTDENAWGAAFTSYLNGNAGGGPSFVGTAQPMSWNWWVWSNPQSQSAGLNPDGIRNSDNSTLNVGQQDWWSLLLYNARNVTIKTSWNPNDEQNITLSNNNLTAATTSIVPQGVRSTSSYTTGNLCWAVTATTMQPNLATGIGSALWAFNPGSPYSIEFVPGYGAGQGVYLNNVRLTIGSVPSVSGEELDFCANLGSQLLYVSSPTMVSSSGAGSWNNSNTCNPTVAACGLSFAGMVGPYYLDFYDSNGGGEANAVGVLNTTGPFANSIMSSLPTGYTTWDAATVAGTGHPIIQILGANDNYAPANDNLMRVSYAYPSLLRSAPRH